MADTLLAVRLVGRQRQLDIVGGWVDELVAGRGRAALVEGEPGIGKSTLVQHAARQARAAGCLVLAGACDELSQAFPLLPLLDAFDVRVDTGGTFDVRVDTSGTFDGRAVGRGRAQIMDILRSEAAPGNRVDPVAAATERLLVMIDEVSTAGPLMLVLDDLQWADPATVVAWGRLARAVRQLPLLLVGIARPVPRREDLAALRRVIEPAGRLRLHSLSEVDAAELVARAAGGTPGPGLLRLAAGAAGNPLYLTELIDALIRGRALAVDDGRVEVTVGRGPDSLAAAIADRLEFLTAPAREVLRAAALLGADFSVGELAVVSGRRVSDLLPVLGEAIAAGVVRDDGPQLAFRHPLIRAALYEGMPAAVRAAWHRDAGRALAQQGAAPERVARQLLPMLGASETVDGWLVRWLTDAGQQLVGQAPAAAIPLLRWAVTGIPAGVPPHDLLSCRLADALFRVGDVAGAAGVATGALGSVTNPDLLVDLHWTLTNCRSMEGRSEESVAALRRALDAPGVEGRHRARLLVLTARAHRSLGRVDIAGQVAATALAEATAADDRWAMAWSLGILTLVQGMRGEFAEALATVGRALAVAEGHPGLTDLRLVLGINQAVELGNLDRYGDAIVAAQQIRERSEGAGNALRLAQARSVLGELLFDVGRWDDALAEIAPGSDTPKHPVVECCDRGVAATIRLHRGSASASRDLNRAERFSARLGDQVIGSLVLARSLAREQAGAPAEAFAVLTGGLSDTAEDMENLTDLFADAVRLAVSLGDRTAGRAVAERAEAAALDSAVPHRTAVALHCRGLLDHDAAALLRAAGQYEVAGRPLPRAQALEAAGVALADADDITGARGRFTDAFAVYAALGAGWDLARTQARFRAYGIRRGPRVAHRRSQRGWDSLTPTELTVVDLVARGMSNPQIAGVLFLSRRTVQTHVSHVLAKLGVTSRTDIVREAGRRQQPSTG